MGRSCGPPGSLVRLIAGQDAPRTRCSVCPTNAADAAVSCSELAGYIAIALRYKISCAPARSPAVRYDQPRCVLGCDGA